MKKLRTVLAWLLAIPAGFAVVWGIVIFWWQTSLRVVTLDDAILYLGLLPACLVTAVGVVGWLKARKRHPAAATEEGKSDDTAAAMPDSAARPVVIMAAWASTPAGTTAAEYLEALLERRIRPVPDKRLTDDQGFPLLAGRLDDVDTDSVRTWLAATAPASSDDEWRESFLRSLALLDRVLEQAIVEWPFPLSSTQDDPIGRNTSFTLKGTHPVDDKVVDAALALHVTLLLPDHFQDSELHLAKRFLMYRMNPLPTAAQRVDIIRTSADAKAFSLAEQFRISSLSAPAPQALLLLAADSSLCPSIVEVWESDKRLFVGSRQPNGLMPGEGGFSVLYANESAADSAFTEPLCQQVAVAVANRKTSIDVRDMPADACTTQTLRSALINADVEGKNIGAVACDADHRISRALECVRAMLDQTPHLDAVQHRISSNEVCGHLGAASALAALVAGATHAATAESPLLVLTLSHPTERAATVLLPHVPVGV